MILMPQLSESIIKINDEQAAYAKKISSKMSDSKSRRKGMIDLLGIMCAAECFKMYGFKVNALRGLHNIAEILEEFEINDIYVNNYRIDVIVQFKDERIRIPLGHKNYDCAPDFYVVVRLSERLKEASIVGFFKPSQVSHSHISEGYIVADRVNMLTISALYLELKKPVKPKMPTSKHLECISKFLMFIDGELPEESKKGFIKHLLTCPACVKKLTDVIDFNRTVKSMQHLDSLVEKCCCEASEDEIFKSFKKTSSRAKDNCACVKSNSAREDEALLEQKYINIIDNIFANSPKGESSGLYAFGAKKRKILITAAVILIFLFTSVFIAFKSSNAEISSISDVGSEYSSETEYDRSQQQSEFTSSFDLPQEVYGASNMPDYSLASKATGEPLVATINKISWEVPENIANKSNYTRFLQLVGKNVKLNLQNDLLLSNDFAKNSVIKLSVRIANNGDVIGMRIVQSSGTQAIDEIIKKSVSETLSYMKPPSYGFMSRPVDVTLVISL